MIISVVPNPALDKTIVLPDFNVGQIHRAREVLTLAGGKGFNFARALQVLGELVRVIAPIGGYAGQQLLALAAQEGLAVDPQPVAADLRTCLTVIDPRADYRLTEIYEQGSSLSIDEWSALVRRVGLASEHADMLVICGSFPLGTPDDGLATLLQQASSTNIPVLLDTHGSQLAGVLAWRPALLKINQFEAAELLGCRITTPAQALEAAADLQQRGAQSVVISLGAIGVVGRSIDHQSFGWASPPVDAVCATGSGDCLLAGIAAGIARGESLAEAARLGVAAGAANTLVIGAGRLDLQSVERLLSAVQAIRLDG
jgi:1-phosphofructokinase family hexose kinase